MFVEQTEMLDPGPGTHTEARAVRRDAAHLALLCAFVQCVQCVQCVQAAAAGQAQSPFSKDRQKVFVEQMLDSGPGTHTEARAVRRDAAHLALLCAFVQCVQCVQCVQAAAAGLGKPAFLRQAREFLFFPLLPREASKRVSIFDREAREAQIRFPAG